MASSADIETALVNEVASALYPQAGPAFAQAVTIARGWPTEADLRAAIAMPTSLIGVYALSETVKDITTALRQWQCLSPGVGALEVGRMEQVFQLDIWATTPSIRDDLLKLLQSSLKFKMRYDLPDGSVATMVKLLTLEPDDKTSRAYEWAQSLQITIQYPVLYTQVQSIVSSPPAVDVTILP